MYLVSKTSKACARPARPTATGAKPSVQNFELIELTKNHQFEDEYRWFTVRFSELEMDLVMKLLFPKEWREIDHEDDLETFFRHSVAVFNSDGWFLCVPKDEVLEK